MRAGFSLVELSIVLVILGLLTGGILAGKSLVRASELRNVSSTLQRYQSAVFGFREKYFYVPGDIPNATSFFGSVTASGGTCPNGAGTGTQTCDGDGNGRITNSAGNYYENVRAWQHLASAGLVEGGYTGVQNGSSPYITIGTNVPTSRISSAGYSLVSYGSAYGYTGAPSESWDGANWKVAIFFGSNVNDATRGRTVLSPEEVWNMDSKMDDGKPDYGRVQSGVATGTCFTSATSPSAYDVTVTDKVCNLILRMIE